MDIVISTGSTIYLSDVGHNGFLYPDENKPETVFTETHGERLSWVGGGDSYVPVKINKSSIYATDSSTSKVVVWVKK